MSLFQCESCGCVENTALSHQGFSYEENFDWTGMEHVRGLRLCSACGPSTLADGEPARKGGQWHGQFPRTYLPKGKFRTADNGNLEHIETGDQDFDKWALDSEDPAPAPGPKRQVGMVGHSRVLLGAMAALAAAGGPMPFVNYRLENHDDDAGNGQTSKRPARYDTDALRDDEQRIKEAQARRERKRMKRLQQAKRGGS